MHNSRFQTMKELVDFLSSIRSEVGYQRWDEAVRELQRQRIAKGDRERRRFIPHKWIEAAFVRQKGICPGCQEVMIFGEAVGDHFIPLSKGGRHRKDNIRAMHSGCNAQKSDNDPVQEARRTGTTVVDQLPPRMDPLPEGDRFNE